MADKVSARFVERPFDAGDLTINVAEGPAARSPLVMLHGATADWRSYRDLMIQLPSRWRGLACDLRGHGKSGRDGDRYRLADYVCDIVAFVRSQAEPSVVVGHLLGALTALGVAAQAPESVCALVLLDPPVYLRDARVGLRSKAAEWFGWVYETMRSDPSFSAVVDACRKRMSATRGAEVVELVDRVSHVAPESVGVVLRGKLLEGIDLAETVREVRQPTLLVRGDWTSGGAMRDEDVEWFHAQVPQARIFHIPSGSHLFPHKEAEATRVAIESFLDSLR